MIRYSAIFNLFQFSSSPPSTAIMHSLFEEVLTKRDLSKAGTLFSLEDKEIEDDLSEVVKVIHEIADGKEYEESDNDQSVVEICITRVSSAIR